MDIQHALTCASDYLGVYDGDEQVSVSACKRLLQICGLVITKFFKTFQYTSKLLCGTQKPRNFVSETSTVRFVFHSDSVSTSKGFELQWSLEGTDVLLNQK